MATIGGLILLVPPFPTMGFAAPVDPPIWKSNGLNITDSLLNPLEAGRTELDVRIQIAGILHGARNDGAKVVRWIVDTTWPQYQCSRDPEDQSTGQMDPAWYTISRLLMEGASREGLKVVVVLADVTGDTFVGLPHDAPGRESLVAAWTDHRAAQNGSDRYNHVVHPCSVVFQNGYHGKVTAHEIFGDPAIVMALAKRFYAMAEFLKQFPSLGAIELFNEPNYEETETTTFGSAVHDIRSYLYSSDPTLREIPMSSGVAAWNETIVDELDNTGDFVFEPYVGYHYYRSNNLSSKAVADEIAELSSYIRRVAKGKPLVFSEVGAQVAISTPRQHEDFFKTLLASGSAAHAGLWFWGSFFDDDAPAPNFRWTFNSISLIGQSYRQQVIDTNREHSYSRPKKVNFFRMRGARHDQTSDAVSITAIADTEANPVLQQRWVLSIGASRYVIVSRAGVLLTAPSTSYAASYYTNSSIGIEADQAAKRWLEVQHNPPGWSVSVFECAMSSVGERVTPLYVLSYAQRFGRRDFQSCLQSNEILVGRL